jgi:S1-C subfamily serine protease
VAAGSTIPGVSTTDARGRFRVTDLAEGSVVLDAFAADFGRARQQVNVSAGETTRDVRIVLRAEPGEKSHEPGAAGSLAVTLGETGDPAEVVVVTVGDASEAERAGLAPGDALESIDGAKVTTMEDARAKMSGPLGDDVLLTVRRGDREESLRVPREPVRR